jgi:superfamily I DNA/RNA helicase
MHRLKGLEFRRVLLAYVQDGEMPKRLPPGTLADKASIEDHEKRERCLLYVAATRARDQLMITGYGRQSSLLL